MIWVEHDPVPAAVQVTPIHRVGLAFQNHIQYIENRVGAQTAIGIDIRDEDEIEGRGCERRRVMVGVVAVSSTMIGLGTTCTGLGQIPGAWVVKENTAEAGPRVVSLIGAIFQ